MRWCLSSWEEALAGEGEVDAVRTEEALYALGIERKHGLEVVHRGRRG